MKIMYDSDLRKYKILDVFDLVFDNQYVYIELEDNKKFVIVNKYWNGHKQSIRFSIKQLQRFKGKIGYEIFDR